MASNDSLRRRIDVFSQNQEAKQRYSCPYCIEQVTFDFILIKMSSNRIELREATCTECYNVIIESRSYMPSKSKKGPFGKIPLQKPIYTDWEIIYPKLRKYCINKKIPKKIRKYLNEAASVIDISLIGAISLIRTCLNDVLSTYEGKNLEDKIKNCEYPEDIKKKLHAIRKCGNYSLHPSNEIEPSPEEVKFAIKSLKEFLVYKYIDQEEEDNKMMEQIGYKSKESKK